MHWLIHWIWAGLFVRSAVILIAAELLRRFPRKTSPAYRHRVVLAGFAMLLVWPVSSALLPQIHLALWPRLTGGTVTVEQTLLRFGRQTSAPHSPELECRLTAILTPQAARRGRSLPLTGISVLTLLTVAASAVTVVPRQVTASPGGSPMKHTLLAGLMASAGLSAATIGGSLFDATGAVVSNAKASLYNPDTTATKQITTTPEGKFVFDNLPAGQYILHIEKPGFASLFRAFNVQAESNVERGLFLQLPSTSAAAQPIPSHPGQLRIGGGVAESNLTNKVQPIYPPSAKAAGIEGTVSLDVAISKEGVPEEISVVSSPGDDLTQSALDAVRQWRYRPTLLNGQPVDILTNVIVNYTLAK